MPAPNPQRRDHLADTAIAVLAEHGSRGLTHRAVDGAAAVPPGTTSRYFRTREALLGGIIDRIAEELDRRVDAYAVDAVSRDELEDALVNVMTTMQSDGRHDPLALFELHLEATRNPGLRRMLTEALTRRRDLIIRQCRVAGIEVDETDAMLLEMSVLGVMFTTLTTGVPGTAEESIRAAVRALLSRACGS